MRAFGIFWLIRLSTVWCYVGREYIDTQECTFQSQTLLENNRMVYVLSHTGTKVHAGIGHRKLRFLEASRRILITLERNGAIPLLAENGSILAHFS